MPPKLQRRVTLSAGEECTVAGNGHVQVVLLTGAVDVAGCVLELNRPTSFYLATGARALVLATLEGGSVSLASDGPVTVHKGPTGAATLVQLTRRTLLSLERATVLIIGDHHGGKTLAAHTLGNLLRRYAVEADGDEEGGAQGCRVCLVDFNAESNALYSPGCVSAVELPSYEQADASKLWLGHTATPTQLPLSFFAGMAARPSSKDVNSFLHVCEQLYDTTVALLQQGGTTAAVSVATNADHSGAGYASQRPFIVVDCPTPEADLREGVFYKKLIEMVKPTHVVVVGSREAMQTGNDWCSFLQEDVQRILPDCDFVFVEPCSRPCAQPPRELLMQEYFVGTPHLPLGCSKVVVSAQSLHFVSLESEEGDAAVVARRLSPVARWKGLVCGLSHAETLEEVPLAPLAGLLCIAAVDEEKEEVVMVVPAPQQEPLQRRFVMLPSAGRGWATMCVTDTQAATIEESVVV